jgi:hypothetical protein
MKTNARKFGWIPASLLIACALHASPLRADTPLTQVSLFYGHCLGGKPSKAGSLGAKSAQGRWVDPFTGQIGWEISINDKLQVTLDATAAGYPNPIILGTLVAPADGDFCPNGQDPDVIAPWEVQLNPNLSLGYSFTTGRCSYTHSGWGTSLAGWIKPITIQLALKWGENSQFSTRSRSYETSSPFAGSKQECASYEP